MKLFYLLFSTILLAAIAWAEPETPWVQEWEDEPRTNDDLVDISSNSQGPMTEHPTEVVFKSSVTGVEQLRVKESTDQEKGYWIFVPERP